MVVVGVEGITGDEIWTVRWEDAGRKLLSVWQVVSTDLKLIAVASHLAARFLHFLFAKDSAHLEPRISTLKVLVVGVSKHRRDLRSKRGVGNGEGKWRWRPFATTVMCCWSTRPFTNR